MEAGALIGSGEAGVEAMGEDATDEEESEDMIDASEEVSDPSMEAVASERLEEVREEVGVACTVVEWTESLVWGSP